MAHAKLSPSSAHRWLRCPASVGYVERLRSEGAIPEEERSQFTDEGTMAHDFAAKALVSYDLGLDFDWGSIPDAIMRSHVRAYFDLVVSKITGDGQLYVEHEVPLFYDPESTGTSDAIVLTDDALYVFDLKYGQGVSVEAEENDQLAIYAESFVRAHPFIGSGPPKDFKVIPCIFQPRAREGAPLREWFTTLGELAMLTTTMGAKARKLARGESDSEYHAGDKQCRFCPAKKRCHPYAEFCTLDVKNEFGDVVNGDCGILASKAEGLSDGDIARIAKVAIDGRFVKWLNMVAEYALELRLAGKLADTGLKVVKTTPRRKWRDDLGAGKLLRPILGLNVAMPRSTISPAQAEKVLKTHDVDEKFWVKFNAMVEYPEGAPTLALSSDKREEYIPPTALSEFGDDADDLL